MESVSYREDSVYEEIDNHGYQTIDEYPSHKARASEAEDEYQTIDEYPSHNARASEAENEFGEGTEKNVTDDQGYEIVPKKSE